MKAKVISPPEMQERRKIAGSGPLKKLANIKPQPALVKAIKGDGAKTGAPKGKKKPAVGNAAGLLSGVLKRR